MQEEFDISQDPEFLKRYKAWARKAEARAKVQWPELETPDHFDLIKAEELPEEPPQEERLCFHLVTCRAISIQAQVYFDLRNVNYRHVQNNLWIIILAYDPYAENDDIETSTQIIRVRSTGIIFFIDAQGCARTIQEERR